MPQAISYDNGRLLRENVLQQMSDLFNRRSVVSGKQASNGFVTYQTGVSCFPMRALIRDNTCEHAPVPKSVTVPASIDTQWAAEPSSPDLMRVTVNVGVPACEAEKPGRTQFNTSGVKNLLYTIIRNAGLARTGQEILLSHHCVWEEKDTPEWLREQAGKFLRPVAAVGRAHVEVVRYGRIGNQYGERFILVFHKCDLAQVATAIEKMRKERGAGVAR
ncbi:MAG: hypothetical protein KGJ06_05870 [Pseudomonadota bacterium]|nr:hypothetical protein [Pseudomonadota bacterium]